MSQRDLDMASTVADSCAGWGATSASDEEEAEPLSPCRPIVKNTFIVIAPEDLLLGGSARRRTQSEPRVANVEGSSRGAAQVIEVRQGRETLRSVRVCAPPTPTGSQKS